jgi:hypothetical protein
MNDKEFKQIKKATDMLNESIKGQWVPMHYDFPIAQVYPKPYSLILNCKSCGYETVQVQYPDGKHRCMRCGTLWEPGDVEVVKGVGVIKGVSNVYK